MMVECKLKSLTVERRLLREYLYLPGLSLSLSQAALLAGVDAASCQLVLDHLVNARTLTRSESGAYVREARYRNLDGWKSLVRTRLAALSPKHPSRPKAVKSVQPQTGDRRFEESAGSGL